MNLLLSYSYLVYLVYLVYTKKIFIAWSKLLRLYWILKWSSHSAKVYSAKSLNPAVSSYCSSIFFQCLITYSSLRPENGKLWWFLLLYLQENIFKDGHTIIIASKYTYIYTYIILILHVYLLDFHSINLIDINIRVCYVKTIIYAIFVDIGLFLIAKFQI